MLYSFAPLRSVGWFSGPEQLREGLGEALAVVARHNVPGEQIQAELALSGQQGKAPDTLAASQLQLFSPS